MKKMIDFLKNMLLTIVYPNRILNYFRVKNLDQNSNKILGNDLIVKILALVLTVAFVMAARYTPATTTNHIVELDSMPINTEINEGYTYIGSPIPMVDIILSGDRAQIDILLASGGVSADLDLRDLEPGTYNNIVIRVGAVNGQSISEQITVTVNPSIVSGIEIDRLGTKKLPVVPLAELPDLGNRYDYDITVYPSYVEVSGPQRFLEEIDVVRAIFDSSSMIVESGNTVFEGILVAHDNAAHPVAGIEIYPPIVDVRIEIFEDTRTIDLEVNDSLLDVPTRHVIREVTANIDEIQVWGNFTDMDSVIELPRISFTDLDDEGHVTIPILPLLPNGVFSETTEVEITVIYEVQPPPPEPNEDDEDET